MTMTNSILIVEDDKTLRDVLQYNFAKEGYRVLTAEDGLKALETARREHPDIIVLDVMLPQMSGFEVCRELRKETSTPILMLTARDEEVDRIVGLDIGADDYMSKPFSLRELLARVRALLRRSNITENHPAAKGNIKVGDIEIDAGRHQATLRGQPLYLTPKEFDLLLFLATNKGMAFTREQLLEKVWGFDYPGETRTVDVHVRYLREKIESDPSAPVYIVTVRGVGYKLEG
jgi:two-component system OmpR family response regulator